jgi:hypothetical protein
MTHDGRALRILVLTDEYTRECLALRVARRLGSVQVIETLADVLLLRGIRAHSFGPWDGVRRQRAAFPARSLRVVGPVC